MKFKEVDDKKDEVYVLRVNGDTIHLQSVGAVWTETTQIKDYTRVDKECSHWTTVFKKGNKAITIGWNQVVFIEDDKDVCNFFLGSGEEKSIHLIKALEND